MQNSLPSNNWEDLSLENIIVGTSDNGVSFLKLFLIDYSKQFNNFALNPSCRRCLVGYHKDWINIKRKKNMSNSNYKLKAEYKQIALRNFGDGYNFLVTNENITDEYALILLERFPAEKIFEKYPKTEDIEVNDVEVVAPVQRKKRRK